MDQLALNNQNLDKLPKIDSSVKKIDASHNQLTHLQALVKCHNMQQLKLNNNLISSMLDIANLTNIVVLNLSYNKLTSMNGLQKLNRLCALILNNNQISKICNLDSCILLNTLVLSSNQIKYLDNVSHLKNIRKLQISHNLIESMDGICGLNMEELRINDNKIKTIPESIKHFNKLRIFDIGKNQIDNILSIEQLQNLKLINLNIQGNPCSSEALSIALKFPKIRIINNLPTESALANHNDKIPAKLKDKGNQKAQKNKKVKKAQITKPIADLKPAEQILEQQEKQETPQLKVVTNPRSVPRLNQKKSAVTKVEKFKNEKQQKVTSKLLAKTTNNNVEKW